LKRHFAALATLPRSPPLLRSPAGAFFDEASGPAAMAADEARLMAPRPLPFFLFPRLDLLYGRLVADAEARGAARFLAGRRAARVERAAAGRGGAGDSGGARPAVTDAEGRREEFDAVVLACHAPAALALLAAPTALDRAVLGGAEYYRQQTILHADEGWVARRAGVEFFGPRGAGGGPPNRQRGGGALALEGRRPGRRPARSAIWALGRA
jgi:hypothetical protein